MSARYSIETELTLTGIYVSLCLLGRNGQIIREMAYWEMENGATGRSFAAPDIPRHMLSALHALCQCLLAEHAQKETTTNAMGAAAVLGALERKDCLP